MKYSYKNNYVDNSKKNVFYAQNIMVKEEDKKKDLIAVILKQQEELQK